MPGRGVPCVRGVSKGRGGVEGGTRVYGSVIPSCACSAPPRPGALPHFKAAPPHGKLGHQPPTNNELYCSAKPKGSNCLLVKWAVTAFCLCASAYDVVCSFQAVEGKRWLIHGGTSDTLARLWISVCPASFFPWSVYLCCCFKVFIFTCRITVLYIRTPISHMDALKTNIMDTRCMMILKLN